MVEALRSERYTAVPRAMKIKQARRDAIRCGCSPRTHFGAENGLATVPNIGAFIVIQPLNAVDQLHAIEVDDDLIDPASETNDEDGGPSLRSSFLPEVSAITVPTMLVQNLNDPMMNKDSIDGYFERLPGEKKIAWVYRAPARLADYDHFANHPQGMLDFFDAYSPAHA